MTDVPPEPAYLPLFLPDAAPASQPFDDDRAFRLGDRRDVGPPVRYVFDESLTIAVNVALATGRPLLLRGHPGTGKSSMARSVAAHLGWRLYSTTVSSRTTARDLQWTFDIVARLADAETKGVALRPRAAYVTPGPLWWAFDAALARRRGLSPDELAATNGAVTELDDPSEIVGIDPNGNAVFRDGDVRPGDAVVMSGRRAVVLIDEIDKADLDVPNDLLQPLGSLQFQVDDGPMVKAMSPPFVVITTNEERDLPRAFVRRCVVHTLEQPSRARLRDIAIAHSRGQHDDALFEAVMAEYVPVRKRRIAANEPPPSVAELLDVLAACRSLRTGTADRVWGTLARALLDKAVAIPDELPLGPDEAATESGDGGDPAAQATAVERGDSRAE